MQSYARRKAGDFDGLYLTGVVQRGLGNYADAEGPLRQAVALKPGDYDSRYNLGFVLAKLGKTAEARKELDIALKLRPDSSNARFQLAAGLRPMGDPEQARAELQTFDNEKRESISQNVTETKASPANHYLQTAEVHRARTLYGQ